MDVNPVFRFIDMITSPIRRCFSWIVRVTPGLKKLPSLSVPTIVALVSLFVLIIAWAIICLGFNVGEHWARKGALFVVPFVLATIIYWLVRVLMWKEISKFPNIDRVWETAISHCKDHGISLTDIPIFLVLGAKDHKQASNLTKASKIPIDVVVPDQQDTDIVFFGGKQAAFLYLNGCSNMSGLSSAPLVASHAEKTPFLQPAASRFKGTIEGDIFDQTSHGASAPAPRSLGGTLTEGFVPPAQTNLSATADFNATPLSPQRGLGGTIVHDDLFPEESSLLQPRSSPQPKQSRSTPSEDRFEREQKLRYVCELLNKARHPFCPINGMLTLLPFELVESSSGPVQAAAQLDLKILRQELGVRCGNIVVISEMEKEDGFQEMAKRYGEQRCRDQRFGKGSELWNEPSADRLEAIAVHAVGAFEDSVYMLFQKENSLQQKHNSRLLQLLCRVRGPFGQNLPTVLARGFGFDPKTEPQLATRQFLFGGCYFSGAGPDPTRYAFIQSVFQKMTEMQDELEWSPEFRSKERLLQRLSGIFYLVGAISLVAIISWVVAKSLASD